MNKKVYLDNAATTPLDERVFEKMLPYLKEHFGNPSSIHSFGRKTRIALEEARELIASTINADPSEIYFTSNGTEANNLAVFGIAKTEFEDSGKNGIITTAAEHKCILEPFEYLESKGFESNILSVIEDSTLSPDVLESALNKNTSLVSAIHINNETGGINDIKTLASVTQGAGAWFHTDAVQSYGKTRIDVKSLGIHSLSASGHKFFGPKGSGFTYAKSGTPLSPMLIGGSQERNRRGGTENPAAIIGLAEAARLANLEMEENFVKVRELKTRFCEILLNSGIEALSMNDDDKFSPYILSLTFSSEKYNNDAESMLMFLDINGVAASNGAACTSGTLKPSHVILATGKSAGDTNGTIRFSLSPKNTFEEIEYACTVLLKMSKNFHL